MNMMKAVVTMEIRLVVLGALVLLVAVKVAAVVQQATSGEITDLPSTSNSPESLSESSATRPTSTSTSQDSSSRHLMGSSIIVNGSTMSMAEVTSSPAVAMVTSIPVPTLDRSFATNLYWLKMDATLPVDTDLTDNDFIATLETNLATAYSEGRAILDQRQLAVEQLLDRLDPNNDPLLNRRKRAQSVNGNTAQVIDISREVTYPTNVVMVFYMAEGDTTMPAGESKVVFSEISIQELTYYLQIVVQSAPTEYIPVVTTATPPPAPSYLWVVGVVLGGVALVCLGCCCCFCCCCRRPRRDGPMDLDTLKMLQYKKKYPYKPYKTPNQTPRGFDIAKTTVITKATHHGNDAEVGASSGGSVLQRSSTSSLDTSVNIPEVPPLQLCMDEGDAIHQAVDSSVEVSSRGQGSRVGVNQPRLLPLRKQEVSSSVLGSSDRVSYVNVDNRSRKKRFSKKKRQPSFSETEHGDARDGNSLPSTHYARQPPTQMTPKKHPEPLVETRRRVHHLIDEAFSLVNLHKNAISPAPLAASSIATSSIATETKEQPGEMIPERTEDSLPRKDGDGTRVVVVPVSHVPLTTGSLVWNPYRAEEELKQLYKSQQLMFDVASRPKERRLSSHLSLPHPVSIPDPENKEAGIKDGGPTRDQVLEQRNRDSRRRSSTGCGRLSTELRRPSTDLDHSKDLLKEELNTKETKRPSTDLGRLSTELRRQSTDLRRSSTGFDQSKHLKEELNTKETKKPSTDLIRRPSTYSGKPSTVLTDLRRSSADLGRLPTDIQPTANRAAARLLANGGDGGPEVNQVPSRNQEPALLETLSNETPVGKPAIDRHEENDVNQARSGQLVAAIRDELIRMAKKNIKTGETS